MTVAGEPKEIPEFLRAVHPQAHRVFFGALDPAGLTLAERLIRKLPASRKLLPEGDFRDWAEIEAWAREIDDQMKQLQGTREEVTPDERAAGTTN